MNLSHIAVRAFVSYVALLLLARLSGKRFVAECSAREFVLAALIGDMIDDVLWAEVGADRFIVAIATLGIIQLLISIAAMHNDFIDNVVNGKPTLLMKSGKPARTGMRMERMNEKAVARQLRHAGVSRDQWDEVDRAWVETDGSVSAFRVDKAKEITKQDVAAVRERIPQ